MTASLRVQVFPSLLLALAFALAPHASQSQALSRVRRFELVDAHDGLASLAIQALQQDRHGFMWIGTQDGLHRYDGHRARLYVQHPQRRDALGGNFIAALLLDSAGSLWVGTDGGGVSRYEEATDSFLTYRHDPQRSDSLSNDYVVSMAEGLPGEIWITLRDAGINILDSRTGLVQRGVLDPAGRLLAHSDATALRRDGDFMWAGSNGSGLARFDLRGGEAQRFAPMSSGLRSATVGRVVRHPTLGLIAASYGAGLDRYDERTGRFAPLTDFPGARCMHGDLRIRRPAVALDGSIWIASSTGVSVLDPNMLTCDAELQGPPGSGLPRDTVSDLFVDRAGRVWIGTYGGVAWHDPQTLGLGHFRLGGLASAGREVSDVWALLEDSRGDLWIGGYSTRLARVDRKSRAVTYLDGLQRTGPVATDAVIDLVEDEHRRLWVAATSGLFLVDAGRTRVTAIEPRGAAPKSLYDSLTAIELDGDALWIGAQESGAMRLGFDGAVRDRLTSDSARRALASNAITDIYRDARGRIWFATWGGGVSALDPAADSLTTFRHDPRDPQSLSSDTTLSITADAAQTLWIGTSAGLDRLDAQSGKITRYSATEGLLGAQVGCVLVDGEQGVWVAASAGLSLLDPQVGRFVATFYDTDGLPGELNAHACARGRSGTLYFGGVGGFSAFAHHVSRQAWSPASVVLTDFALFGQSVAPGPQSAKYGLSAPIHQAQTLTLGRRDTMFGFEFAALDFADPRRRRYQYRMLGLDERWMTTPAERSFASFAGVKPGAYRFEVRAVDSHGARFSSVTGVDVLVRAAPWATGWAYALYVVLSGGAALLYFRLRTRALRARALRLEQTIDARTNEIAQERQKVQDLDASRRRLVAAVSHDLRVPLASVHGYLETLTLRRDALTGEEQRTYIDGALGATRRATRLVNELFDLSRLESPDFQLRRELVNLADLVADVASELKGRARQQGVDIRTEFVERLPMTAADIGLLERVIYNLLDNALRHSRRTAEITVAVFRDNGSICVSVADSGPGIPAEHLERIFVPFFRIPEPDVAGIARGTGLGLATAQKIVALHGGFIRASNKADGGAVLTFGIPVA